MVVRPPAPSATPVLVATLVANPVSVDTSKSYALVPLVATALATTSVTGWSTFLICALAAGETADRKSTRLNSSHLVISYAVFCLKKKKHNQHHPRHENQSTGVATGA